MNRCIYFLSTIAIVSLLGCFPKPSVKNVRLSEWDYPSLQKTQNLRMQGKIFYKTKEYTKSIACYQQIFSLGKGRTQDYHRTAQAYAKINITDSAFTYLNIYLKMKCINGISLSWPAQDQNDTSYTSLKDDSVFTYLKSDVRWQALIDTLDNRTNNLKSNLNKQLANELILMSKEDARVRTKSKDDKEEMKVDSLNQKKFDTIVQKYGIPGISTVGWEGIIGVFQIIQHYGADGMRKYYPTIKELALKGEFPPLLLAYIEDRNNMFNAIPQIYGTQLCPSSLLSIFTKKVELYPVAEEAYVDVRRAEVGLEPLKDYLKNFGIKYKPKIKK